MESASHDVEVSRYVASTPKSKALQEEAAAYLPGGSSRGTQFFEPHPFFADRGEGHYVYDVDGNRYLDFMLNATTLILGHAHPDITAAVQDQAAKGVSFSVPTGSQARLAKLICDRVPSIDSVRFTNSGTEATLYAIRARPRVHRPAQDREVRGRLPRHPRVRVCQLQPVPRPARPRRPDRHTGV